MALGTSVFYDTHFSGKEVCLLCVFSFSMLICGIPWAPIVRLLYMSVKPLTG